jgi:uncharacterized membrane protein YphA (DoxX/SURF4 family)
MSDDLSLLLLRLVVGGLMVGHGAQKLFGWSGPAQSSRVTRGCVRPGSGPCWPR